MNVRKDRTRVGVDGGWSHTSAEGVEEELDLLALGQEFHQIKLERYSVYAVISSSGDLAYRSNTSHWASDLIRLCVRRRVTVDVLTGSISDAAERTHLLFILTQLDEVFKRDHRRHARQITGENLEWKNTQFISFDCQISVKMLKYTMKSKPTSPEFTSALF